MMTDGVEIQVLRPGQGETMNQALTALYDHEPASDEAAEAFLADWHNYLSVAYVDGTLAGFVLAYDLGLPDGQSVLLIYQVEVAAAFRDRGVGSALIESCRARAAARHSIRMIAPTERSNTGAVALFRSMGGVEAAPDDVVFTWKFE